MNLKRWMFILVLLIFCCINGYISQTCHDEKRNSRPWYCCNNHQEINGICVECGIGFISDAGELCRKCPDGFYGSKCVSFCNCKATESCHHIKGCIEEVETTVIVENESTSAYPITHCVTYDTNLSLEPFTTTELPELTTENNKFVQVTSVNGNNFVGMSSSNCTYGNVFVCQPDLTLKGVYNVCIFKSDIAVYSVSIGGFACLILVILCLVRYKRNFRNRSAILDIKHTRNNVPVDRISIECTAGIYETIDESKMIDAPLDASVAIIVENTSSENSTDNDHSLQNNEYLNPYQPMVPDTGKHVYDEQSLHKSEYLNPYQPMVPDTEKHEYDEHSLNDNKYLNPYQPLLPDTEKHVYNEYSLNDIDYLHPYQPMVPDTDKHVYDERSLHDIEYLNPYEPMVPDTENHAYDVATRVTMDDSGLFESKENDSGHWNPPCQQTVPYSAGQNYFSIQAEFHRLGSSTFNENENEHDNRKEKDVEQMKYEEETKNI